MNNIFKNKKIIVAVCVPVIAVLLGLSAWAVVDNSSRSILEDPPIVNKAEDLDEIISDDTQKAENSDSVDNTANDVIPEENKVISEKLSAEDISLKNEIAKVTSNAADFRNKRNITLNGKKYELTFSNMGDDNKIYENENITYVNSVGDKFIYNLHTGNLLKVEISSAKTTDITKKISEADAQKIAYEYAKNGRDISAYNLDTPDADEYGYTFVYRRYVSGYSTEDRVKISVGYDGAIVGVADSRDDFIGKSFVVDENKIKSENERILASMPAGSYIKRQWIGLGDGKLCMMTMVIDGETGKIANPIAAIPLE